MIRNKAIYKERGKGKTLKEIAEPHNITSERVRQILVEKNLEKCVKHNTRFLDFCEYCKTEKVFSELIDTLPLCDLLQEISNYLKNDRLKMIVLKRTFLAKLLRNKFKMTYPKIGKILNRYHSTVIRMCEK